MTERLRSARTVKVLGCLATALTLALGGCGLDDVDVPDLDGPSTFGQALVLTVNPDVVTADGLSTALITAELRDQDGRLVSGRDVFFALADELGRFAEVGKLFDLNGVQVGATDAIVRTDGSGLAHLVYRAPNRTDATANQTILILARPVGTDFNGAFYRTVRLELRSAEPRMFPSVPTCDVPGSPDPPFCNRAPSCPFVVEFPQGFPPEVGEQVLFQSRAFDFEGGTIVRYEWFFGDGSGTEYFPEVNHAFPFAGTFTVTHTCTDDDGAQSASSTTITVVP